mmetsp:Transcript_44875/g.65961  ORF Transcript_44875/g.65961 Transcript_44875/m.65961 type:complete len:191 (+) Transcript_44875:50-622(+)|eukprot:CAMPEP_0195517200 /NCGR_PEP_ID=MMETSP0794_2-20130614/10236_1 /TAXON_ID=515487 /ORGANISM="Stephanopyxis turris, Strain CCMP 815" /LENGTH=190 /DNA_ID=CAMNT_0040645969 /DNA_START=50 /DNA_END=622 /DNA_ORIENTATION=-
MPAINSAFNEEAESVETTISKIPFLNIKTKHRGPMGNADPSSVDIIDEAISLYRANVLMSSMEIKGTADHLLIYLTLTISEVIKRLVDPATGAPTSRSKATAAMTKMKSDLAMPGSAKFPSKLEHFIPPPKSGEEDSLKAYFKQLRAEVISRLLKDILYVDDQPNKWWFQWWRRDFMGMALFTFSRDLPK